MPTDRLFVIGNGDADSGTAPRSDALVMLKNGNTRLNGSLTIDGDNTGTGSWTRYETIFESLIQYFPRVRRQVS